MVNATESKLRILHISPAELTTIITKAGRDITPGASALGHGARWSVAELMGGVGPHARKAESQGLLVRAA